MMEIHCANRSCSRVLMVTIQRMFGRIEAVKKILHERGWKPSPEIEDAWECDRCSA
jgi:hypothetical protein